MESLSANDLSIYREKCRAFQGTVKIPLNKLKYEELPQNPRQFDEKNVLALLRRFRTGCLRHEPDNYVPALVSLSSIPEGLLCNDSDDAIGAYKMPPLWDPEQPLVYLNGRHRLEAASRFFPSNNDRWWIVNLYSDDLSPQAKEVLREKDFGPSKFEQGDIFRQIRIATKCNDTPRRDKWLAKLTPNQQTNVLRLESLPDQFLKSLDALIPFATLWRAIKLGTFPRLTKLHCTEELTRCLRRIRSTWRYIIGEKESDQLRIDADTPNLLQGRCPYRSSEDRAYIKMRMLAGAILPNIRSESQRSAILRRICSIPYMIPSIYTFLEDSKYLELGSNILKELLPGKGKGSLFQQFDALHDKRTNMKVQTSEFTFETRIMASVEQSSRIAYIQIWAFCLRHFPFMGGLVPRRDKREDLKVEKGEQEQWWCELSTLASTVGYKKMRLKYRDRTAADAVAIQECLQRIRPPEYYRVDPEQQRRMVQLIYQVIGDTPYSAPVMTIPPMVSDTEHCGSDILDRCGRPRQQSFQKDKNSLFFDFIFPTNDHHSPGRYLTSFAIKRDFFHAFFGTPEDTSPSFQTLPPSPLPSSPLPPEESPEFQDSSSTSDECNSDSLPYKDQQRSLPRIQIQRADQSMDNTHPTSPYTDESHYSCSPTLSTPGEAIKSPFRISQPFTGPWTPLPSNANQSPIFVFGQQNTVSLTDASRLLSGDPRSLSNHRFNVLSPTEDGGFRKRKADPLDHVSMASALRLGSDVYYMTQTSGKRLKMTMPSSIIEKARSGRLKTVVTTSQHTMRELISRFERIEDLEEEL